MEAPERLSFQCGEYRNRIPKIPKLLVLMYFRGSSNLQENTVFVNSGPPTF